MTVLITESVPNFVGLYIIVPTLLAILAIVIYDTIRRNRPVRRKRSTRLRWWLGIVIAAATSFAVVNTTTYLVSANSGERSRATVSEVAKSFGFVSGKAYPLVLGDRFVGSSGELDIQSGLFSFTASGSTKPATAISVSFEHQGKSYLLELPTKNITFIQADDKKPVLKINLKHRNALYSDYNYSSGKGLGSLDTLVTRTFGDCAEQWVDFTLRCIRPVETTEIRIGKTIDLDGLSPIMDEHFRNAQITLTPEMYHQLLGR
ncbi:MAG: hypothetical protein ABIR91_03920 [Candidatus Saccharimonadales bacterium]